MSSRTSIPLLRLLRIIRSNGGLGANGWLHLVPWLVKTTLLEPFRWWEWIRYHKKISKEEPDPAPVFILGHYRSGTTFLQRMFMQDDRFGYTSLFQTVLPEIMLTAERFLTPLLDRLSRVLKLRNHFHRIPLQWQSFPGEEDVGMTALIYPTGSQWGLLFPERSQYYQEQLILLNDAAAKHQQTWKEDYRYYLKKLSVQNRGKPLVLKNPPNTARIEILLSLFPNARFIHIMRNPVEVISSTKNLRKVIMDHYQLGQDSWWQNGESIIEHYRALMKAYREQKHLIPPAQLVEIAYEDFVKDPVNTMQWIYKEFSLPSFEQCREKMVAFARAERSYKVLSYRPSPSSEHYLQQKLQEQIRYWIQLRESNKILLDEKDHTRAG